MNRFSLCIALTLLSFTGVGCCYCGPVFDPCCGGNYGGCAGGLFDTCCTGGYSDPCCDPCGGSSYGYGPSMGYAAPMSGPGCCTAPTTSWQSGAVPSNHVMTHSTTPTLSVPTPAGMTSGPVSYHHSQSTSSGLKVTSHPEAAPVYQQSSSSPWIRAGY